MRRVFRRLTAAAIVLASLLGAAAPVLACSSTAASSHCCGEGSPAPCTDGDNCLLGVLPGAVHCYVSQPAAATKFVVDSGRSGCERLDHAPATDPRLDARPAAAERAGPVPPSFAASRAATLTYLRTARLRL
jgi:hypothetical protein